MMRVLGTNFYNFNRPAIAASSSSGRVSRLDYIELPGSELAKKQVIAKSIIGYHLDEHALCELIHEAYQLTKGYSLEGLEKELNKREKEAAETIKTDPLSKMIEKDKKEAEKFS